MGKHRLPLPPPGGYLICNDNEFCFADTTVGPGKPVYECVPNVTPSNGPERMAVEQIYRETAEQAGIFCIANELGQNSVEYENQLFLLDHVDKAARILFNRQEMFGGESLLVALSAVNRATKKGFDGMYLKLPMSNDNRHDPNFDWIYKSRPLRR